MGLNLVRVRVPPRAQFDNFFTYATINLMFKKRFFYFLVLVFCFFFLGASFFEIKAVGPTGSRENIIVSPTLEGGQDEESTETAEVKEEKAEKITESTEEVKGRLTLILENQKLTAPGVGNFLKYAIRKSVDHGIPPNTIVLIFLLPVVATLIAAVRHIIGISGFGIFTPVMISVAFIATGLSQGLILFLIVLSVAILTRMVLRQTRVHFLPRMSLLLWAICLAVFALLYFGPQLHFEDVADISIFPILIVILLAENFIEVLIGKSSSEAIHLTWQTLLVAILGYWILNWQPLQGFVLLNPELVSLTVLLVNIFLGRYTRLRWMEFSRFKSIFKK